MDVFKNIIGVVFCSLFVYMAILGAFIPSIKDVFNKNEKVIHRIISGVLLVAFTPVYVFFVLIIVGMVLEIFIK